MMFQFRGVPVREINGLPYSIHQIGEEQWQIAIQNCARHPAGYTFAPVYGSYEEARVALDNWPEHPHDLTARFAGDDTGVAELALYED